MYEIIIDEDIKVIKDFCGYLEKLRNNKDSNKDYKIRFNKIVAYMNKLEEYGVSMGMPFTRHLYNEIWELRPLNDRILYAVVKDNKIVLLNYFVKKSQKTSRKEIAIAKNNLEKFLSKESANENME